MNIETIFEIVEDALASVKYEEEPLNAFEYCFALWCDMEYLEDFFHQNFADLDHWGLSVQGAMEKVMKESIQFRREIDEFARLGKTSVTKNLDARFLPLSKVDLSKERLKSKAYGSRNSHSMLRIYAIRLGPNC